VRPDHGIRVPNTRNPQPATTFDPPPEIVWTDTAIRPIATTHDCRTRLHVLTMADGSGPFTDRTFMIDECSECGLGVTRPIPTEDTAHLLYEARQSADFQAEDSRLVWRLKEFAARKDVRGFCKGVEIRDGALMLDFGCGNGAFVAAMQEVFPRARVMGTDQHPAPPSVLRPEQYLPYGHLDELRGICSLILCRHVLEHTYDPVKLLSELRGLLEPGGVVALEVPSLESKVKSIFGRFWDGYNAPYHPLHFTRRSLRAAVETAGFSVIREGGAEMPKMGRSLRNVLGTKYGLGLFTVGMALQPLQVGIGLVTGTSVCLRIWGRN
jgi:SAM-dependent methyltransferase